MINSIIIKNPTADQNFPLKEKVVKIKVKSSSGFFNEIPVLKKGADINVSFEILGGKKVSYSIFLVINGADNLVDSGNYNLSDATIPIFKYSKNIFVSSNKQSEYLTLKPGQYGIKIKATEGGKSSSETVIIKLVEEPAVNNAEIPEGYFDTEEPKANNLQIFGEITKPHNLQVFDDNFFKIDENGIPKNYIPINLQIKTTDKPKNKASYKIILRDTITKAEAPIDGGNLLPFLFNSKKSIFNVLSPQEATIEILLPLFKNGTYQVYAYMEADEAKGTSHTKTFSVNITKQVNLPKTTPEIPTEPLPPAPEQTLPKPPLPAEPLPQAPEQTLPKPPVKIIPLPPPEIFGTEGIGTIDVVDERIKDLGLQAPYLKTYLYQNGKNKVLFQIEKFFLISEDYDKQIRKLQEQQQYKIINNLVKELFLDRISANIYMTENKPETFTDIVNKSNLFKTLIVSNNELNFENYLDVNKDYYFLVEAEQGKTTNENEKIYDYSGLQKIKIIKDEELYFIENNQVATVEKFKGDFILGGPVIETYTLKYYDFIDKEKIKTFLGKAFIESKFTFPGYNLNKVPGLIGSVDKLFNLSEAKFDSSQNNSKYIKLRITSKKTNRKIDINLNYSFKPEPQVIKSFEEIKSKDNKKLEINVSFSILKKAPVEFLQQFNFFLQELRKFIPIYNAENNLQIYELSQQENKTDTIFSFANFNNWYEFIISFSEYIKKQNSNLKYDVAVAILTTAIIKVI